MAKLSSFLKYLSNIDLYRNSIFNVQRIVGPSIYEGTSLGTSLELSTNDEISRSGHLILRTGTAENSGSVYIFAGKNSEFNDGNFSPSDDTNPYEGITIHPDTDISIISSIKNIELQAKEGIYISKGSKGNRNTLDNKDSYVGFYKDKDKEYIKIYSINNVEINPKTLLNEYGSSLAQTFDSSAEKFGNLNIYAGATNGKNADNKSSYTLEVTKNSSTEKIQNVNIYGTLGFTGTEINLEPTESFNLACPKENSNLKINSDKDSSYIEAIAGNITNELTIANVLNLTGNSKFNINAKGITDLNLENSFNLIEKTGSNAKTIIASILKDKERTTTLNVDKANISTSLTSDTKTTLNGTTNISEGESDTLAIGGNSTTITSKKVELGIPTSNISELFSYVANQKNYIQTLEQQIESSTRRLGIKNGEVNTSNSEAEYVERVYSSGGAEDTKWEYEATSKTSYSLDTNNYSLKSSNSLSLMGPEKEELKDSEEKNLGLNQFSLIANTSGSTEFLNNLILDKSFELTKGEFTLGGDVDSLTIRAKTVNFNDATSFALDSPKIEIGKNTPENTRLYIKSSNGFELEVDNTTTSLNGETTSKDTSTVKIKNARIDNYLSIYDTLKLGVDSSGESNSKGFKLISPVKLTQTAYEFDIKHCDASGKEIEKTSILTSAYSGNNNVRKAILNVEDASINTKLTSSKSTELKTTTNISGTLGVTGDSASITSSDITIGNNNNSKLTVEGSSLTETLTKSIRTIGSTVFKEEINNDALSLVKITAPKYSLTSETSLKIYGNGKDKTGSFYLEAENSSADLKATIIKASDKLQAKNSVEIGSIDSTEGMSIYWDSSSKSIIFAAIGA